MLADHVAFRAELGFQAAVAKAAEAEGVTVSDFIRDVVREKLARAGVQIDRNYRHPLPRRRHEAA